MKKILTFILCSLFSVLVARAAVSFNPSSVTIEVGETVEVTATGETADNTGYTGQWTTSFSPTGHATAEATRTDTRTATVKFTGSVAGQTTCTVTHQYRTSSSYKETGTISITVQDPPPPGRELSGGLRISEICPKPQRKREPAAKYEPDATVDDVDPNGVPSGWVELVNAGETPVDIGEYELQRFNRGKKASAGKFANLPSRTLAPGKRVVIWTNEGYIDGGDLVFAEPKMTADEVKEIDGAIIFPGKVSAKKFPMVRLLKGKDVIDTVIVPADTPDGCSIVVRDPDEDGATCRCLVTQPTPGAANRYSGAVRLGPQIGPLYGVKQDDDISDLDPQPPAKTGEDYGVVLDVNPVLGGTEKDEIASVTLVYRTDINSTATAEIAMTSGEEPDPVRGRRWTAAIPADRLPKPGMLIQWKAKITDAGGNTWTSPAFNDKDNGYEWYGTVVDPGVGESDGQNSPTLPTLHLFVATGNASYPQADQPGKPTSTSDKTHTLGDQCMMNLDYDEVFIDPQTKSGKTAWANAYPYGARCAIYDFQTSNYYDNVRIDCRGNSSDDYYKRSHGLRFSKLKAYRIAEPFNHPVSGEKVKEVRKTSLHGEFNDPAMFRQRMSFWFLNAVGVPAPWEHPKRVNLNGKFYQFAYETPRFSEELLCDFYGFNENGYGYKNVGSLHLWNNSHYGQSGSSADAGTKKKTPDDGDEYDHTELLAFHKEIEGVSSIKDSASNPNDTTGLDNATVTKKVVEKFDLPAWINYLAATKITQEGDDAWGNLSIYYDNFKLLDGTVCGTGTWRPVAWDLNCAWGQFYTVHVGNIRTGLHADQDWNKCHPLYGGRRILGYKSSSASTSNSNYGYNGANYGFEAVFQSTKFRRLFLRRLRTLMDAYLKPTDTSEDATPIAVQMKAYVDEIQAEAVKDRGIWGHLGQTSGNKDCDWVNCWGTSLVSAGGRQPDYPLDGYTDIWQNYIVPRRVHLYTTHSVDAGNVGYGLKQSAGIPHAQSAIADLAAKISLKSDVRLGTVVVENRNAETIDLSGWQLTGPVKMTLPPGTILDQGTDKAPGELYVTADRRATVAKLTLSDQVIVGNGKVGEVGDTFRLKATDAAETVIDSGVTNLSAQIRFSEVQSSNSKTYVDEKGETPDWVELYNAGDKPVDLGGWGLSDKKKKPFKWTFPVGTVIEPGAYLLVFAGLGDGPLYTGFSLSSDGETLYLTDWKETTVDTVTFGTIPCDTSFGRRTDGTETYFGKPSPGEANGGQTYDEPVGEVIFSQPRGLCESAFDLELSNAVAGATIRYTTDHSEPSTTHGEIYSGPIRIEDTTVVKATAYKDGHLPYRNVTANTYIFIDKVADQVKSSSVCPDTWSDNGASTPASYGVSTSAVKTGDDRQAFVAALKSAPIVSISLDDNDLFGSADGIYTHPESLEDKPNETRQADIEWVTGKEPDDVFGVGVGLTVHGAYSRKFDMSPKKSFRLSFSTDYGVSTLKHPVLKDGGCETEEFKKLILRGEHNYSWTQIKTSSGSVPKSERATYMCDQFFRSTQELTSGFQVHGTHVHLFLNGMYWGLYNLTEHVSDGFAATTWSDDIDYRKGYDVITPDGVRDGTADGFNAVKTLVSGGIGTQARFDALVSCFDLVGYIDHVLIQQYLGNEDWPDNNWVVAGSATLGVPYRYVLWDVEKSLNDVTANLWSKSSGAMSFHNTLKSSAEYKLLFADRVHRHLFGNGALTADAVVARYRAMADEVRPRLFAEAARWGAYQYDYKVGTKTQYGLGAWETRLDDLTGTWFPTRFANLLQQLKDAGLYPAQDAAEFATEDGAHATLTVPAGATVYYTTDGTDPRQMFTGEALGDPYTAGETIVLPTGGTVKARARKGDTWSALSEIELAPPNNAFKPTDGADWDDDANWTRGTYPNAADADAVIGVPEKVKAKGWRNIHINSNDISVAYLEFTNGGKTNRVDTGDNGGGDLTLYGTIAVMDAGAAMIDLDAPCRIALATNLEANIAAGGELIFKGTLAGNGYDLRNAGPGRLTLDCTGANALGKLQCEAGVIAVLKPLAVGSVTKDGDLWVKAGATTLEEAIPLALASAGKCNPNVSVFVPTEYGGATWYGGVVATKFGGTVTAYVPSESGEVTFDGRRWTECTAAEIDKVDAGEGLTTYCVKIPYFGPAIKVGGTDYATLEEAVAAANSTTPMVFAVVPTVDNAAHTIAIADGTPVAVAEHYDLSLSETTVTLSLNEIVQPMPIVFTEVRWNKGRMENISRRGFTTCRGFWYALGIGGVAKTGWIAGDGTPHYIEPPDDGEYDVLVSDIEQK